MSRLDMRWAYCAAALIGLILGAMVYEQIAWDWHFAREEAPGASVWHLLRGAAVALLSVAFVTTFAKARGGHREGAIAPGWQGAAWIVAGLAAGLTIVLAVDPTQYQALGSEDGAIEWVSALLLFGASLFSALHLFNLLRQPWRWLEMCAAAGFALLFFVMAMEEVSWFQRVIGFATPEAVAARNWQGEFNLHNFHTDLTELALYTATALFLMLLPLAREVIGDRGLIAPVKRILPDRPVAAISASMLVFTYSHWNLLPVQAAFWTGLATCAVFAVWSRGGERVLWVVLAMLVAVGQAVHLALGHTMLAIYDASEFRELFFAVGLAAYGWRQWRT